MRHSAARNLFPFRTRRNEAHPIENVYSRKTPHDPALREGCEVGCCQKADSLFAPWANPLEMPSLQSVQRSIRNGLLRPVLGKDALAGCPARTAIPRRNSGDGSFFAGLSQHPKKRPPGSEGTESAVTG
jgi:hypothetical protein